MKRLVILLGMLGVVFLPPFVLADDLAGAIKQLDTKSYSKKVKAVNAIGEIDDPRVLDVLLALREGQLYIHKGNKNFVIGRGESSEGLVRIVDAVTGEKLDDIASGALSKIKINNRVRGAARTAISKIQLSAKDKSTRLNAVRNLIKSPDDKLRDLIVAALDNEENSEVIKGLNVALAFIDINSNDKKLRISAIEVLGETVEPRAVTILQDILSKDEEGNSEEEDSEIIRSAEKSLEKIESRTSLYEFIKNLFFGLSLGSILLLAAIGLAITFGVMGVINMAHGEMIMIGAYTTFFVQQLFPNWVGGSILLSIPLAFLASGLVGVVIERTIIRHLYGRPLETLLATFGVSLILQQLARTYNSNNVPVKAPDWLSGSWHINSVLEFNYVHMYIIVFSLIVLAVLTLVLKKTYLGLQMRAVTQNRAMANSMGIRSSWVDALTFGLGSGIAGIAGVALSQIGNVGPNLGQGYIIDSFMVVVFGGVGNLLGTFFGGVSLGIVNKFLEPQVGAVVAKIIVLVFIILFIQWRPRGLFALKGRFVED